MTTLTNGKKAQPEAVKLAFLELFPEVGSVKDTCDKLGLNRRTLHHWRTNDLEFEKEYQIAAKQTLTLLEDEAYRRAVTGIQKPIFQGGHKVGFVTEYSDTLLLALLKARDPQKYRERFTGEITGPDGKPLLGDLKMIHVHSNIPLATSEDEIDERKQIEDIPFVDLPSPELNHIEDGKQ